MGKTHFLTLVFIGPRTTNSFVQYEFPKNSFVQYEFPKHSIDHSLPTSEQLTINFWTLGHLSTENQIFEKKLDFDHTGAPILL